MRMFVIGIVLSIRAFVWDATNTPYDDLRSWAHNHSSTIWDAPEELWDRLPADQRARLDALYEKLDEEGAL